MERFYTNIHITISVLLYFCILTETEAQPIWGVGSTNSHQDSVASFASPDGSLASLGWTTDGVPAAALWSWSADGSTTGYLTPGWVNSGRASYISSPSLNNGVAIFESDLLDGGTNGPSASGVAPASHTGNLYSPPIDLSNYIDSTIAINFYTAYFKWESQSNNQPTDLYLAISTDHGNSWEEKKIEFYAQDDNEGQVDGYLAQYNDQIRVNFEVPYGNHADSSLIRFKFDGRYYFWSIDDVSITNGDLHDLCFVSRVEEYDYQNASHLMPYAEIPLSQAASDSAVIGCKVIAFNRGTADILSSANPRVEIIIEKYNGLTHSVVHTETIPFTSGVNAGDTATVEFIPTYRPNEATHYRLTYMLKHDNIENNLSDNTLSRSFKVTTDWYSKVGYADNGNLNYDYFRSVASFAPNAPDLLTTWEYGSLFYFPRGTGYLLDSIHYALYASTLTDNSLNEIIVTSKIYKWNDLDGNNTVDFFTGDGTAIQGGDWTWEAFALDTIPVYANLYGSYFERKKYLADLNNLNPQTNAYDLPYALEDDGLYFITLHQQDINNGLIDLNGQRRCFYPAVYTNVIYDTYIDDYSAEMDLSHVSAYLYTENTSGTNTTSGPYVRFTGQPLQFPPAIALKVTNQNLVNVQQTSPLASRFELYPNPSTDLINVELELKENVSSVQYIITDAVGRVVHMDQEESTMDKKIQKQFNVSDYSQGIYFLHCRTDKGVFSKQFIIQ
ncbi:MAG: T9SS type A sorting domain-containing protein [Saprospiraceae bacterium]|nr:T9SS type A sorting domain-containing protein [Saprospiraceae bacterium]